MSSIAIGFRGLMVPGLKFHRDVYMQELQANIVAEVDWLDIGCGKSILADWRHHEEKALVSRAHVLAGVDLDKTSLKQNTSIIEKAICDISRLPFRDELFDVVTANMVVEHLNNPKAQFIEVARVLKPGGLFIFSTPNKKDPLVFTSRLLPRLLLLRVLGIIESRKEDDAFETHYMANSCKEIKSLAAQTYFHVRNINLIVSTPIFESIPLIHMLEVLWLRISLSRPFKPIRSNIIAILEKNII
jgi:2-polyprenyl-3-methyl-5-hydroxy-6-metoxy-1,4-benzoquinol methylase